MFGQPVQGLGFLVQSTGFLPTDFPSGEQEDLESVIFLQHTGNGGTLLVPRGVEGNTHIP